jgi:hypothetical protein
MNNYWETEMPITEHVEFSDDCICHTCVWLRIRQEEADEECEEEQLIRQELDDAARNPHDFSTDDES